MVTWERERERDESKIRLAHFDEFKKSFKFNDKVSYTKRIIKDFFFEVDNIHKSSDKKEEKLEFLICFSGGKDSTVLLDLVIKTFKEIKDSLKTKVIRLTPAYAYEITFPETKKFIESIAQKYKDENDFVNELLYKKPKLAWYDVLNKKGYPIFSKQLSVILNRIKNVKSKNGLTRWIFKIDTTRYGLSKKRLFLLDDNIKNFPTSKENKLIDDYYFNIDHLLNKNYENFNNYYSEKCCNYIKGGLKNIKLPSFVGVTAFESQLRKQSWVKFGCNIINPKKQISRPLSIWCETDIWKYIIKNKIKINPKYGFDDIQEVDYTNDCQIIRTIENLSYKRLGCISCPYGSHLEKNKNRFEILYEQSKLLYESQVIKNGMYKVLIDMDIKIRNDEKYMILYEERRKQIDLYNKNIHKNIFDIIAQIENHNNYKNYKNRTKNPSWSYTFDEIKMILDNYDIKKENNEKYSEIEIIHEIKQSREKAKINFNNRGKNNGKNIRN